MRRSLVAAVALLISGFVGNAQEKASAHITIQAAPEQIKRAALAMFVRNGYSLDSDTWLPGGLLHNETSPLKISRPFSSEETSAYNTANWTNPPVANCRHVQAFLLSPANQATDVTMVSETVCHTDGQWLIRSDERQTPCTQTTLAELKAKIEEGNQRH
jgi:hypothetical protein